MVMMSALAGIGGGRAMSQMLKKKKKKKHWQFPAHIFDLVEHYESVLKTRSCVLKLIY